jgi:hypothetical protein
MEDVDILQSSGSCDAKHVVRVYDYVDSQVLSSQSRDCTILMRTDGI